MANKTVVVSAKIPEEIYKEFTLRVEKGGRSSFILDALVEKLEKTPRPDKFFELDERMSKMEGKLSEIKALLAKLEVLTIEQGKINPHAFGIDDIDHKIINYILHYKGATTPELAEKFGTNRWLILNRLRRIQKLSREQLGKSIIEYYSGEKMGKKKAWWLNEDLIGE